jgi:hypothetical protein
VHFFFASRQQRQRALSVSPSTVSQISDGVIEMCAAGRRRRRAVQAAMDAVAACCFLLMRASTQEFLKD